MPLLRWFNGDLVKRTIRVGEQVAVVVKGRDKDAPNRQLLLPLDEYLTGLTTSFHETKEAVHEVLSAAAVVSSK